MGDSTDNRTWRGCEGVEFVRAENSDHKLIYDGKAYDYWKIEDEMWERFRQDNPHLYGAWDEARTESRYACEELYTVYCQEHIKEFLDEAKPEDYQGW